MEYGILSIRISWSTELRQTDADLVRKDNSFQIQLVQLNLIPFSCRETLYSTEFIKNTSNLITLQTFINHVTHSFPKSQSRDLSIYNLYHLHFPISMKVNAI